MLERRIGIPLFERTRSGARPTPAGERFIQDATVGAVHLGEAIKSLALAQCGHSGEIRLGIMTSLASGFLADLLRSYHHKFPSVEMKLEEGSAQLNASAVLNGRLDAAIISGESRISGCETERLWYERIHLAVPAAHRLNDIPSITWDEVREETFLVTADAAGRELEDYLIRQLSSQGFRPNISVQRIGRENLLNMVAWGMGITVTTDSTLGITYPTLRFHPIVSSENVVASNLIWSASNQNPALKLLIGMSRDRARGGK
jgi:DNA-binding transcriptional LysR family regulator